MTLPHFDAYYADPHWAHFNIIRYSNRPFRDTPHQIEELTRRYNAQVSPESDVLWLGDCLFPRDREYAKSIMGQLNGRKYLLRGNHDRKVTDTKFLEYGFEQVFPTHFSASLGGYAVRYSHYPYEGYSQDKRYPDLRPAREPGVVLIHGHTHEPNQLTHQGTVHVGVDAWGYAPAPYEAVLELVKQAHTA